MTDPTHKSLQLTALTGIPAVEENDDLWAQIVTMRVAVGLDKIVISWCIFVVWQYRHMRPILPDNAP